MFSVRRDADGEEFAVKVFDKKTVVKNGLEVVGWGYFEKLLERGGDPEENEPPKHHEVLRVVRRGDLHVLPDGVVQRRPPGS